jgi:cytochrome c5
MFRPLLSVFIVALSFSSAAFAITSQQATDDAIAARIKPVGSVYTAGSEPIAAKPTGPRTGAQVYNTFCVACHATGVSGAPIKGNAEAWAPRLAQGKEILKNHALNGFNAMPMKGTCMDCSDDEIVAAIEHLTEGL